MDYYIQAYLLVGRPTATTTTFQVENHERLTSPLNRTIRRRRRVPRFPGLLSSFVQAGIFSQGKPERTIEEKRETGQNTCNEGRVRLNKVGSLERGRWRAAGQGWTVFSPFPLDYHRAYWLHNEVGGDNKTCQGKSTLGSSFWLGWNVRQRCDNTRFLEDGLFWYQYYRF